MVLSFEKVFLFQVAFTASCIASLRFVLQVIVCDGFILASTIQLVLAHSKV